MSKGDIEEPENKILFNVTDPEGVSVLLYAEQWDHIKKEHPDINPIAKVRSGVQNPDLILLDEARNARIYTTISSTSLSFNVFAGIVTETECRIRTSYRMRDIPKGDCTWRRPKK